MYSWNWLFLNQKHLLSGLQWNMGILGSFLLTVLIWNWEDREKTITTVSNKLRNQKHFQFLKKNIWNSIIELLLLSNFYKREHLGSNNIIRHSLWSYSGLICHWNKYEFMNSTKLVDCAHLLQHYCALYVRIIDIF